MCLTKGIGDMGDNYGDLYMDDTLGGSSLGEEIVGSKFPIKEMDSVQFAL